MTSKLWAFAIGAAVSLSLSKERGTVIGRAELAASEDSYLIRYKAANGQQIETWWGASALAAKPAPKKAQPARPKASFLPPIPPVKLSFDKKASRAAK